MARKTSTPTPWQEICKGLRAVADPKVAQHYRQIAPTNGEILGITVPVLRAMVKDFADAHRDLTASDAASLADQAFNSACREEMLFASFLLARFKAKLEPALWPRIDRWINGIDNWEACDQLSTAVAAEMIARTAEPLRGQWIGDLEAWTSSPSPWRRRFAAATTTSLNQKGRRDAATAVRICTLLLGDDDKAVQKAVAWALRQATKSDAKAVFSLLHKHRTSMPRTLLRESSEKLSPEQRSALGIV